MNNPCPSCGLPHPHPGSRRHCWFAAHDRAYQRGHRLPITAPERRPPVPDWVMPAGNTVPDNSSFNPTRVSLSCCAHAGGEVGGEQRQALGLSHSRRWFTCGKGHGTGGVVCTCHPTPLGCRGCPDYSASPG